MRTAFLLALVAAGCNSTATPAPASVLLTVDGMD